MDALRQILTAASFVENRTWFDLGGIERVIGGVRSH